MSKDNKEEESEYDTTFNWLPGKKSKSKDKKKSKYTVKNALKGLTGSKGVKVLREMAKRRAEKK